MNNVRIIWKGKNAKDKSGNISKLGYIRLSNRKGNITETKSLSLNPIEKKYFNPKTGRIRTSFLEHEYYNNYIESKLREVEKKGNKIKLINNDRKSLIEFIDKLIERTQNQGTIQKYTNIKNLLVMFNEYKYGDKDVKFSEIDVDYIENFKKWLKDKRNNTANSISYKTKTFQSFVNKALKEKIYFYDVNPFSIVKNKIVDTTIEILNQDDLKKLMTTELTEVYRGKQRFGQIITNKQILTDKRYRHENSLDDIRDFFLFQLFCQGLRVSDLITLRWNDFYIHNDEVRIKKRMVKTRNYIDVLINYRTMGYLKNHIPYTYLTDDLRDSLTTYHSNNLMSIKKSKRRINSLKTQKMPVLINKDVLEKYKLNFESTENQFWVSYEEINKIIIEREKELETTPLDDSVAILLTQRQILNQDQKLIYLKHLRDVVEIVISQRNTTIDNKIEENSLNNYSIFSNIIQYLSNNTLTKTMFCFPILKNNEFINIDTKNDFGTMNERQYLKFSGGRAYYNRLLKVIAEQCKIDKNLKSHISRHSYTSLMLEIGEQINLFDIMTSLGHKHLNTTQKYIQRFNNKKVDILNKQLSDHLSKNNL